MIFYTLVTEQVLKETDIRSVLRVLKRRKIRALFDGFEHIKP